MQSHKTRDHGGGLDAAIARWGGTRADWVDLSTGINPQPYPVTQVPEYAWTMLPDQTAQDDLLAAARSFWKVPHGAAILAAPGASALIARIPALAPAGCVDIPTPTYNEHAAAFLGQDWRLAQTPHARENADARVLVHPNNPTGRLWSQDNVRAPLTVIDESFCDVTPDASLILETTQPGRIVLKSFGKFWGLAGVRLGFAIALPDTIQQLADLCGPWATSGPALHIGAKALHDTTWASDTRTRLATDATRLDDLLLSHGATLAGGTSLFRLYNVDDAAAWQSKLAKAHIWSRVFPYSKTYLRLGLPASDQWSQLEAAL